MQQGQSVLVWGRVRSRQLDRYIGSQSTAGPQQAFNTINRSLLTRLCTLAADAKGSKPLPRPEDVAGGAAGTCKGLSKAPIDTKSFALASALLSVVHNVKTHKLSK